jgi:hypothetical protein
MRRRWLLLLALVAFGLVGGTAYATMTRAKTQAAGSPESGVTRYAPAGEPQQPTEAGVALEQAMRGMTADSSVASATIGTAPQSSAASTTQAASAAGRLPWLYATVRVPSMDDGRDVEPMWEADLLEGAVVARTGTSANVHDSFGGSTFDAVLPNGTKIDDVSGGLGDVARDQSFDQSSDAAIRSSITSALGADGLTPVSITVFRALDGAPAVVASTSNPQAAVAKLGVIQADLFGKPPHYEGFYLELRDSTGNPFVHSSASFRTGAGRFWVDPRLAAEVRGVVAGTRPTP